MSSTATTVAAINLNKHNAGADLERAQVRLPAWHSTCYPDQTFLMPGTQPRITDNTACSAQERAKVQFRISPEPTNGESAPWKQTRSVMHEFPLRLRPIPIHAAGFAGTNALTTRAGLPAESGTACVVLFLNGGPSHHDTVDPNALFDNPQGRPISVPDGWCLSQNCGGRTSVIFRGPA